MKRMVLMFAMIFVAVALFAQKKESLALFPFTGGNASDGTAIVSSLARQRLLREAFNRVTLVTQNTIATMNFEQRFQRSSGLTDADTIFELGKALNASHVIAGYITKLGDRNLVIVSIMDVESLQQIAGDYRAYSTIEEIDALIPSIAQKLASAVPRNTSSLPGLSVPPFNIASGINQNDAMALAQILSCDLANSGKYAVLPRTDSIDKVMEEQKRQRSGVTDQDRIKRLGVGRNAQFVLSGSVERLGSLNKFAVDILDILSGNFIDGYDEKYTDLSQGFELIPKLAAQLAGVTIAASAPRPVATTATAASTAVQSASPLKDFDINGTTLVKYLGNDANVTIPNTVKVIGKEAFKGYTKLASVTIPTGVTSIGESAFQGCTGLTNVNILSTNIVIGQYAFFGCTNLYSVTISEGVKSIDKYTFAHCTNLISITIPTSVVSIGECAFWGCKVLMTITFTAGSRLQTIGNSAFSDNQQLTNITIPASVTFIGEAAFESCGLRSITIPAGVKSIGKKSFQYWLSHQTINVQGKANQAAADKAWGAGWREGCDAKINYSR